MDHRARLTVREQLAIIDASLIVWSPSNEPNLTSHDITDISGDAILSQEKTPEAQPMMYTGTPITIREECGNMAALGKVFKP